MAAAIVPLAISALSLIGPQIPSIVRFVEGLFGHSSTTGSKDGEAKAATAVSMLTTALQQLANAGKIPSAPVVDPALPAALAGAVQQAFGVLKAAGALDATPTAQPAPGFSLPSLGKYELTLVRV